MSITAVNEFGYPTMPVSRPGDRAALIEQLKQLGTSGTAKYYDLKESDVRSNGFSGTADKIQKQLDFNA